MKDSDSVEREGKFRYYTKKCFFCEKIIILNFKLTQDKLLFYDEEKNNKLFLEIPRTSVIAINKRQIDKNDVFKFSIYYQNPNEEIIHEIKLKTTTRAETDRWIKELRKLINPKKYEFKYDKDNYIDANELYNFRDMRQFYISLCHLEYILARNIMVNFFRYYKNKDNNNDSASFQYENDTEKLNKENEKNLDINDIQPQFQ